MAGPKSFEGLLKKWCERVKPKRILEWGPGYSTQVMREVCPDAIIISIEHQVKYQQEWAKKFWEDEKTFIVLWSAPEDNREDPDWEFYADSPLKGKFDLIFVDGRERVRCMESIIKRHLLNKGGVVLLHDSERGEYQKGIELFTKLEEDYGTVCLSIPEKK